MAGNFNLEDYVPVSERIAKFWEKHPGGRIETALIELTDKRVVIKALAFRDSLVDKPDATGYSQMSIPGNTPFSRNAEIEVAETSAVGRALAILGFETKKGLASREEVEKASEPPAERPVERPKTKPATAQQKSMVRAKAHEAGLDDLKIKALGRMVTGKPSSTEWTNDDIDKLLVAIADEGVTALLNEGEIKEEDVA